MRNVMMREYRNLDIRIMKDIVENRLDDLATFTRLTMDVE
jgi:uncharacterized protein YutE (UPF0331/DUF86 family)